MSYLYIKSLHVIAVIAWFAGLFYIFRLYVYHTENRDNQEISALLEVMERRLYFAITMPAMIVSLAMGAWMLYLNPEFLNERWLHVKLGAVIVLLGYHFFAGYVRKRFMQKDFFLSSRHCRMINEVPTVLLIIIILMVIVRPF